VHEALLTEPAKRAVYMDHGQSEVIADLLLGKRQIEAQPIDQAVTPETLIEAENEGGHPLLCFHPHDRCCEPFDPPAGFGQK
jgi:hypothetical protein